MARLARPLAATLLALSCAGPAGPPGASGRDGAPGLSGYEIVRRHETVPPSTGYAVKVRCPAGKKAISGGWEGTSETLELNASSPIAEDTWHFWFGNSFGMPQGVSVSVVCAYVPAGR